MYESLRLMSIMAHPDDETLGTGGLLARYAAEGVETFLMTATRGEAGWFGPPEDYPGPDALGRIREQELHAAGQVLGLQEIRFLNYRDGRLDQASPTEIVSQIAAYVREVRPQVVVTFDPTGVYGHPDHIAISQFATAAIVQAASAGNSDPAGRQPHQVSKLYYYVERQENLDLYQEAFGELVMQIDGEERRAQCWKDWVITTSIDTSAYRQVVWEAVDQHRSQIPNYQALIQLPKWKKEQLWSVQHFYRAFSLVNGGRALEDDLFAGLQDSIPGSITAGENGHETV